MAKISKIDYTPGQDNVQLLGLDAHNPVFFVSSLTIVAFVAGVLAFQAGAAAAFVALRAWLMSTYDWVFCHLLRLRIAGHRHHHGRRQTGHADRPARVLVRLRWARRHRAAARRRSLEKHRCRKERLRNTLVPYVFARA